MTGRWVYLSQGVAPSPEACRPNTDAVAFSHHGYWVGLAVGDYGCWWLRGNKLVQQVLHEGGGGSRADRGTTTADSVLHTHPGILTITGKRGPALMIRCSTAADSWFARSRPH